MSFTDYIEKGQVIDLEIELSDTHPIYAARVEEISDSIISVKIIDTDFTAENDFAKKKGIIWGKKKGLKYSFYVIIESIKNSSVFLLKHIPSRSHLRIDAFLIFEYKEITDTGVLQKRKKYIHTMSPDSEGYVFTPSRTISDETDLQTSIPPELINEINSIHRKLDFIIKFLGKTDQENIFNKDPEEVNISGSGMRFTTTEEYKPGDFLDIKLVLPISSGIIIETIGQVVRVNTLADAVQKNDAVRYAIAVKFITINEDDREFIIRYVFKRQRELLRTEEELPPT